MRYVFLSAIVSGIQVNQGKKPPKLLKAITEPLTKSIIQIDKKASECSTNE